jgi:hypothetical protein
MSDEEEKRLDTRWDVNIQVGEVKSVKEIRLIG